MKPDQANLCLMAGPAKTKNSEFSMKHATPEERLGFDSSDAEEWASIMKLGAVRILPKEESKKITTDLPHRVITSR